VFQRNILLSNAFYCNQQRNPFSFFIQFKAHSNQYETVQCIVAHNMNIYNFALVFIRDNIET